MLQYIHKNDLDIYGYINTNREPKRRPIASLDAEIFIDDSQKKLRPILEAKCNDARLFYFRNNGNIQTEITVSSTNIVYDWRSFLRQALGMSRYGQKEVS
jgi:hypothetical protein